MNNCAGNHDTESFINDLPLGIDSLLFMFADDTKLFREIKNQDDNAHLQQDLDELSNWSEKWKLKFHPEKCSVICTSGQDK